MVRPLKWAQMKLKKTGCENTVEEQETERRQRLFVRVWGVGLQSLALVAARWSPLHFLSSVPPCAFSAGRSGVETALLRSYRKLSPPGLAPANAAWLQLLKTLQRRRFRTSWRLRHLSKDCGPAAAAPQQGLWAGGCGTSARMHPSDRPLIWSNTTSSKKLKAR